MVRRDGGPCVAVELDARAVARWSGVIARAVARAVARGALDGRDGRDAEQAAWCAVLEARARARPETEWGLIVVKALERFGRTSERAAVLRPEPPNGSEVLAAVDARAFLTALPPLLADTAVRVGMEEWTHDEIAATAMHSYAPGETVGRAAIGARWRRVCEEARRFFGAETEE